MGRLGPAALYFGRIISGPVEEQPDLWRCLQFHCPAAAAADADAGPVQQWWSFVPGVREPRDLFKRVVQPRERCQLSQRLLLTTA